MSVHNWANSNELLRHSAQPTAVTSNYNSGYTVHEKYEEAWAPALLLWLRRAPLVDILIDVGGRRVADSRLPDFQIDNDHE